MSNRLIDEGWRNGNMDGLLKTPYLSSQEYGFEILCSTPGDCLKEGMSRNFITIPRPDFSLDGYK
jgi:hypothetical protein